MRRNLLFYVAVLAVFGAGIYFMLAVGARLQPTGVAPERRTESAPANSPGQERQPPEAEAAPRSRAGVPHENLRNPLSVLLLQLIVILVAARVFGALFNKAGQPAVIGEMVAGIILGPSLRSEEHTSELQSRFGISYAVFCL